MIPSGLIVGVGCVISRIDLCNTGRVVVPATGSDRQSGDCALCKAVVDTATRSSDDRSDDSVASWFNEFVCRAAYHSTFFGTADVGPPPPNGV